MSRHRTGWLARRIAAWQCAAIERGHRHNGRLGSNGRRHGADQRQEFASRNITRPGLRHRFDCERSARLAKRAAANRPSCHADFWDRCVRPLMQDGSGFDRLSPRAYPEPRQPDATYHGSEPPAERRILSQSGNRGVKESPHFRRCLPTLWTHHMDRQWGLFELGEHDLQSVVLQCRPCGRAVGDFSGGAI